MKPARDLATRPCVLDAFPTVESISLPEIGAALAKLCAYGGRIDAFYSLAQRCVLVADHVALDLQPYALFIGAPTIFVGALSGPARQYVQAATGYDPLHGAAEGVLDTIFAAAGLDRRYLARRAVEIDRAMTAVEAAEYRDILGVTPLSRPLKTRILAQHWTKAFDLWLERLRRLQSLGLIKSSAP